MTKVDDLASESTLEQLYRRYAVWLGGRLRSRIGPEAAADIVQETYLKIAPHNAADIRHPRAFLLRVALNLVRDGARASDRRARGLEQYRPVEAEAAPQFDQVLLVEVVRSMPQLYRDVFVLGRLEGLTYPEIARTLDVSIQTVEWRMARAVEHCASRLDL